MGPRARPEGKAAWNLTGATAFRYRTNEEDSPDRREGHGNSLEHYHHLNRADSNDAQWAPRVPRKQEETVAVILARRSDEPSGSPSIFLSCAIKVTRPPPCKRCGESPVRPERRREILCEVRVTVFRSPDRRTTQTRSP
ncbi:hypothetical protein Lal_00011799 [Lupinus albus]|nr:hypothetical protein Lal_00011799 [Lupinus albus]